jgi:hypothetical protein
MAGFAAGVDYRRCRHVSVFSASKPPRLRALFFLPPADGNKKGARHPAGVQTPFCDFCVFREKTNYACSVQFLFLQSTDGNKKGVRHPAGVQTPFRDFCVFCEKTNYARSVQFLFLQQRMAPKRCQTPCGCADTFLRFLRENQLRAQRAVSFSAIN